MPWLELVDARLADPRKIFDTVSDNAAASGIVIGGRPVRPMDIDLRWVGGIMYVNGEIEETGVAAGVLGHPAMGVAWLANRLGTLGTAMEPGHIVLAGPFTRVVFPKKGERRTPTSGNRAGFRCSTFSASPMTGVMPRDSGASSKHRSCDNNPNRE